MLSAYVLIQTQVGRVAHVAQAITKLDGVQLAEDLAGPYDVIAKVQAPSLDELGRLVASQIQLLDGVTRTLTCVVLHRSRATLRVPLGGGRLWAYRTLAPVA
jgi:DNA-binding Lrp family transcriptional regulator